MKTGIFYVISLGETQENYQPLIRLFEPFFDLFEVEKETYHFHKLDLKTP
ncbi:hypothetical protein CCAND95_200003 [Capnocytophaga canis]|uniref:Uncharacterized protein n=1 Tax=Capnocytophaga canis TaxID=1848903 RepID=A0A0B7HTM2_9FLAO|nr:hypothetical protein [Capnocytophaga canis]CEN43066.1 hypothetical protein CCAND95_200003 [Capnocytophaga canis]CEN44713.1 hypothetical protein CCAND38_190054 [Capnocytophaga canis]